MKRRERTTPDCIGSPCICAAYANGGYRFAVPEDCTCSANVYHQHFDPSCRYYVHPTRWRYFRSNLWRLRYDLFRRLPR